MSSARARQVLTVAVFIVTVAINAAANALPINGQLTAEISDRFRVFVIPAGYVFAIWGLIYVLLGAFTVDQARPSRAADPTLRRLGWLPALTGVLNSIWVLLFQYEVFVLTVPVMLALLGTLIRINAITFADRARLRGTWAWTVRIPFSVYLGWITVATIANIAQTLDAVGFDGFGVQPEHIASAVLLVGIAITATFVWRFADVPYGLVIVWAYAGIVVKESQTPIVSIMAGAGVVLIGGLVLATILRDRPPSATTMIGVGPSAVART